MAKITLDTIADWMELHGHPSYNREIRKLRKAYETGCFPVPLNDLIQEIQQEALDRYNDWASDPLD